MSLHGGVFLSYSKLVPRTKHELLRSASIFRLPLLPRLRQQGDTIITIIIIIIGITGIMKYLRRHAGSIIIRKIPVDPAIVPFRTVGLPWNRPVIVCWTRRTGIIIVRRAKHRRAPHNPLLGSTAAPWRPDAIKVGLWKA